jgi:hypothetical protein
LEFALDRLVPNRDHERKVFGEAVGGSPDGEPSWWTIAALIEAFLKPLNAR